MKYNSTKQNAKRRRDLIATKITNPLLELQQRAKSVFSSSDSPSTSNQFLDKIQSIQTNVQNFILPSSIQKQFSNRPSTEQQLQKAVVMDGKWWLWNMALSCMPGVFVICICEYYRGEMKDYYKRMNMTMEKKQQQQQGATGEKAGSGRVENGMMGSINSGVGGGSGMDDDVNISMFDKIGESIKALFLGISTIPPPTVSVSTPSSNTNENAHTNESMLVQEETKPQDEIKIQELLARIKILEEKLCIEYSNNNNNNNIISNNSHDDDNNTKSTLPETAAIPIPTPMSNIQKRVEMRKRERMEHDEERQQQQKQNRQNQSHNKGLQQAVETKVQEFKDQLYQLIPNIFHGSNNGSTDGDGDCNDDKDAKVEKTSTSTSPSSSSKAHVDVVIIDGDDNHVNSKEYYENGRPTFLNSVQSSHDDISNVQQTENKTEVNTKNANVGVGMVLWKWIQTRFL